MWAELQLDSLAVRCFARNYIQNSLMRCENPKTTTCALDFCPEEVRRTVNDHPGEVAAYNVGQDGAGEAALCACNVVRVDPRGLDFHQRVPGLERWRGNLADFQVTDSAVLLNLSAAPERACPAGRHGHPR